MNDTFRAPMSKQLTLSWVVAGAILFLFFGLRYAGMNAVVMADEWYYSSLTRLTPPADSSIPSYLYNAIYSNATACGTRFLDCVRGLNTVFFLAAAPFIYLVGRRFLTANIASLVALFAMLGPVNSYTAYFMPESFYFCMFWVMSWAAFRFNDRPGFMRAAALGVGVGALALIKLHVLFLIPSIAAFMIYSCLRGKSWSHMPTWGQAIGCIGVMLVLTIAVRLGFGYLVAGNNGLSLAGSLYANQAGNSAGQKLPLLQLIQMCLFNLRGHVSALTIMFGVPVAALALHAIERRAAAEGASARSPLAVYTVLILLALIGMTVAFTAFVAGAGYETNVRLHMRYYNFALPLLVMFGAAQIGRIGQVSKKLAIIIATLLVAAILFTIVTRWQPFMPSMVDSPEFRGMTTRRAGFLVLGTLALLGTAVWARSRDLGARIFLFAFMPLFAIIASINIHHEVRDGGASNDFDRAGIAAHQLLAPAQRDKLAIVGTDVSGMFRTRFHIDSILASQQTAPQKMPLDLSTLPSGTAWVLFLGEYPTPAGAAIRAHGSGYTLIELGGAAAMQ